MLHVRHFLVAVALGTFPLGCTPMGCSGEDPEMDKPAGEQFVGAVEQKLPAATPGTPSLYGTWSGEKLNGQFDTLVLMTNAQYHTSQSVVCVKEPCNPIVQDGSYTLYSKEGRTLIEFHRKPEESLRYEYAVANNTLRIRPLVPGSEWFSMVPAGAAWCGTSNDCKYQNLPPGICAGGYECERSVCAWKCPRGGETSATPDKDTTGAVNPTDSKTP